MKNYIPTAIFMSIILIVLLSSCSGPYDDIKNKTWSGQIYRMSDEKELSNVWLKMSKDTLYLFSNAIFGAENDTLIFENYNGKDSVLTYNSLIGNRFAYKFRHVKTDDSENLILIGNDYFVYLISSGFDIKDQDVLDFYRNISVPRDAYMYLDGTYKGELEMENSFSDLLLGSMGGASVKMLFLEGFQVKIFFRSLFADMFASSSEPSYEIADYTVEGNKLILESNKSKARTVEVKDYGETLILETDALNVVMHKIN